MSVRRPIDATTSEPANDAALLTEFAERGSQSAFTEFVGRYAGFVRAAAARVTRDPQLVEEAAQSVFAILARKSREVARLPHVAGWLHRTTVYVSTRRLRAETRRARRHAVIAETMSTLTASEPEPAWHEALPVLDACIQRLPESDRRVLLMRWFEDRSYSEIAAALGKSQEAGKKQSLRAMDRLSRLLRRRGVVVSAAGLSSGFSSLRPAEAAEAVGNLVTAALKSAPSLAWKSLTLHALHTMPTAKLLTASVLLLLCAAPIMWQESTIASARADVEELENLAAARPSVAVVTAQKSKAPDNNASLNPAGVPTAGPPGIEQVAKDIELTRPSGPVPPAWRSAKERLDALSTEDYVRLLGESSTLSGGQERRTRVEDYLFTELGKLDPAAAIKAAPALVKSRTVEDPGDELQRKIAGVFTAWLKSDPDAALRAFTSLRESGAIERPGTEGNGSITYGIFAGELFPINRAAALGIFRTLDDSGKVQALFHMFRYATVEDRPMLLAEIENAPPRNHAFLMGLMVEAVLNQSGPEAAGALLNGSGMSPEETADVARSAMQGGTGGAPGSKMTLAERMQWLRTYLPEGQFTRAGAKFLAQWSYFPGSVDTRRMAAFREIDWGADRDKAIVALVKDLRRPPEDTGVLVSLALEIKDRAQKLEALHAIRLACFGNTPPAALQAALDQLPDITPAEREAVLTAKKESP